MIHIVNNINLDEKQLKILKACLRITYSSEQFEEPENPSITDNLAKAFAAFLGNSFKSASLESPLLYVQLQESEDLNVRIFEYPRKLPGIKIVAVNYRLVEFLADYIWYLNNGTYEAFVSFICKYLIPIEERDGREKTVMFYKWVWKTYGMPIPVNTIMDPSALSAALFIMFHESTHLNPGLRDSAIAMIEDYENAGNTSTFFFAPSPDFSAINYKQEVVCDFTALSLLIGTQFTKNASEKSDQELSCAFIALSAISVYELFQQLASKTVNASKSQVSHILSILENDVINHRFRNLIRMVQISANSQMEDFVSPMLIENARASSLKIVQFLEHVRDFLKKYQEYKEAYINQ